MRKPSPAMIVALIALFFAIGGSAFAASHYLITSTAQIKPSVVRAIRGQVVIVHGPLEAVAPSSVGVSIATCPSGYIATSGGYSGITNPGAYVNQDEPVGPRTWWAGVSTRLSGEVSYIRATAICTQN
jgi:hypothetical protein